MKILCFSPPSSSQGRGFTGKTAAISGVWTTGSPSWSSSAWVVMEVQRHPIITDVLRLPTFSLEGSLGDPQRDNKESRNFKTPNRESCGFNRPLSILKFWNCFICFGGYRIPIHDDQSTIARWFSDVDTKRSRYSSHPSKRYVVEARFQLPYKAMNICWN